MRRPAPQPASATIAPSTSASGARRTRPLPIRRGPSRVASRQLRQHLAERNASRAEQDEAVEPQVGDFLGDAAVTFAAERRRDYLRRLLADLPAYLRLASREEPGDVRSGGALRLPLSDGALETLEHPGRGRTRIAVDSRVERREEASPLARVTGHTLLVYLDEQRVAVAVGEDGLDVLHVPGRLALRPRLSARARPEVGQAAPECRLHGRPIHPGDHQDLAGVRLLDDCGNQALGVELELVERHGSPRTSTPRPLR